MRLRIVLLMCLVPLAVCRGGEAASITGRIEGTVVDDASGVPIFTAHVVLPSMKMGAMVLDDGFFSIVGVPAGTYVVKAMLDGYETAMRDSVRVSAGETTELHFRLVYTDSLPVFECPHGGVDVCEEHGRELRAVIRRIRYPFAPAAERLDVAEAAIYAEAAARFFPHAGIACAPDMPRGWRIVKTFTCPACRAAREAWLDGHESVKEMLKGRQEFR